MSESDRDHPVSKLFGDLFRQLADRGRARVRRRMQGTREALELRQLRKDRDHFWVRLGKTAYRLVEAGEIDHTALRKAIERIQAIDRQIAELTERAAHAERRDPVADPDPAD